MRRRFDCDHPESFDVAGNVKHRKDQHGCRPVGVRELWIGEAADQPQALD